MRHSLHLVAVAATLLASTSACATRAQTRVATGTLAVASAASVVTGVVTFAHVAGCQPDEYNSCDAYGPVYPIAAALVAAGIGLAYAAHKVHQAGPEDPEVVEREARVAAIGPAAVAAAAPIALPARATDERTLQLARQAARAAAHGQCTAARVTLEQVEDRDAAYHAELRGLDAFARCL